ncbi:MULTISPECIES: fibronectin type III domain-containing protein [Paenibacillus]|uniref:fibronectin type III domain-containing protein n=1 Tax=Paenibacillus TaxID=44249 RepID=UPI0022B88BA6|nr:cohesin domain-containing protein [Paenibacillus caseinilyticus]MCZ8522681.1 cohesin domain-containing protein [Paenibacillus caseinilyticus]
MNSWTKMVSERNSWLAALLFGILLLAVPGYTHASENISVDITKPRVKAKADSKLIIEARISSVYRLQEAKASAGGVEVALTQSCPTCSWTGELEISSLPKGAGTLTVTAEDIRHNTGSASVEFKHDSPPVITRLEPSDHAVIRDSSLHVLAEVKDDLTAIPEYFVGLSRIGDREPFIYDSAQGAPLLDKTYDVSANNSETLRITHQINDGADQYGEPTNSLYINRTVHIENSQAIAEAERIPGVEIIDADAERLLIHKQEKVYIKNRADGSEALIYALDYPSGIQLTPSGAVFMTRYTDYGYRLNIWNGESILPFDIHYGEPYYWQIRGSYLLFVNGPDVHLVNTATLEALRLPVIGGAHYELENTGDVLIDAGEAGGAIQRYRAATGQLEAFIEDPDQPRGPVSDGSTVLYSTADGALHRYEEGSVTTEVYGLHGEQRLQPHSGYEFNQGWIAYEGAEENGVRPIYLKSPEGSVTRATYFNEDADIHYLGGNGTLIVQYKSSLYQYQPGQKELIVIGGVVGRTKPLDGELRYLLGDTIFNITAGAPSDTSAPQWPASDALSVTAVTYNSAQLTWQPADDDTGVAHYLVYVNGTLAKTLDASERTYTAIDLYPESLNSFYVVAVDGTGKRSGKSNIVTVTTQPYIPEPSAALLSLQAKPGPLSAGSVLELQVRAEQAADLYAFLAKLSYDPAKVKLQQVLLSPSFGTEGTDAVLSKNVKTPGTVTAAGSLLGEQSGRTGDPGLLILKFTVLQKGSTVFTLGTETSQADSEGRISKLQAPVSLTVRLDDTDFDQDGVTGLSDLVLISRHSGLSEGQPGYEPKYDLTNDGRVDAKDVQLVAGKVVSA